MIRGPLASATNVFDAIDRAGVFNPFVDRSTQSAIATVVRALCDEFNRALEVYAQRVPEILLQQGAGDYEALERAAERLALAAVAAAKKERDGEPASVAP